MIQRILLVILLLSGTTLTLDSKRHLNNIKNYNSEIKSINQGGTESQYQNADNIYKLYDEEQTEELPSESNKPHKRQKRLIWVTDDGRLALPPGTSLTIAPTLAMPFIRYPPDGFLSNISISLPITIDFDKLGLTDNQNPLGILPPVFARSMGRAAGNMLADYVAKYLRSRTKRSVDAQNSAKTFQPPKNDHIKINRIFEEDEENNEIPKLPDEHKHAFHGGERALLYAAMEDFIANFGLNGKACVLRTICEVHAKSVHNFGMLGEIMKLFFTASKSPFAHLLDEYVEAEQVGKGELGAGECFPYFKDCPKSLFKSNNYSSMTVAHINEDSLDPREKQSSIADKYSTNNHVAM